MSDEEFVSGDAGSSDTYPIQAGALKKGMHCVIKNRPCKIIEYTTSKTGKHGHAKANITATDIFTEKKLEEICPTSHNMYAPNVTRAEYSLIDIADDDQLTLQNAEGDLLEHLNLSTSSKEVQDLVKRKFAAGDDLQVQVVKAMGEEQVMSCKNAA
eukprot:TRINITY_DN1977_c0_g1_i2.p2 TRINITY_DN1977_c0_g1~~TRINITY_DN1977_c0_g1_i2.p2  ORF type:complete len:156 (+),score=93.94 TRINITY_DN1977_c0_g1_i2:52-519(+)